MSVNDNLRTVASFTQLFAMLFMTILSVFMMWAVWWKKPHTRLDKIGSASVYYGYKLPLEPEEGDIWFQYTWNKADVVTLIYQDGEWRPRD